MVHLEPTWGQPGQLAVRKIVLLGLIAGAAFVLLGRQPERAKRPPTVIRGQVPEPPPVFLKPVYQV